jgi:hypothetical protein
MSVHHSDTNQSNEYASTNLLFLLLTACLCVSALLYILCPARLPATRFRPPPSSRAQVPPR